MWQNVRISSWNMKKIANILIDSMYPDIKACTDASQDISSFDPSLVSKHYMIVSWKLWENWKRMGKGCMQIS